MKGSLSRLHVTGVPIIRNLDDLASHTRLSLGLMYRLCRFHNLYYKHFQIPKRDGRPRSIDAPSRPMRAAQVWILDNILCRVKVSSNATAFRKKMSILDNAKIHRAGLYFLSIDVEDFFPSISYDDVVKLFAAVGYPWHACHLLAALCTCCGCLPQGGITSPAISNIVCNRLDRRIEGYARRNRLTYSRYADDITLSSHSPGRLPHALRVVTRILRDEGFRINKRKVRIAGPKRRRIVTGLVINPDDEKNPIGIPRQQKKYVRQLIHAIYHEDVSADERERMRCQLQGWYAYIAHVDPKRRDQLVQYEKDLIADSSSEDTEDAAS